MRRYTDMPAWAGAEGGVSAAVLLFHLQRMRAAGWGGLLGQADLAGQSLPNFGTKGMKDTLNALLTVPALPRTSAARLPCQWNVQMGAGPSLCSGTTNRGGAPCNCLPPKVIYDDATADTQAHPARRLYDFYTPSTPGSAVVRAAAKEYHFTPQSLAAPAAEDEACAEDGDCAAGWSGEFCDHFIEDDSRCADNWQGELCDECALGFRGELCDQRTEEEEEAEACAEGWTGEDCDECAPGFSGEMCDQRTEDEDAEEACAEGWAGEDCDECAPGFSGDLCERRAEAEQEAEACAEGWAGEDCDECAPGFSGELCDQRAGADVAASRMPPDSCAEGWVGSRCDQCGGCPSCSLLVVCCMLFAKGAACCSEWLHR